LIACWESFEWNHYCISLVFPAKYPSSTVFSFAHAGLGSIAFYLYADAHLKLLLIVFSGVMLFITSGFHLFKLFQSSSFRLQNTVQTEPALCYLSWSEIPCNYNECNLE